MGTEKFGGHISFKSFVPECDISIICFVLGKGPTLVPVTGVGRTNIPLDMALAKVGCWEEHKENSLSPGVTMDFCEETKGLPSPLI